MKLDNHIFDNDYFNEDVGCVRISDAGRRTLKHLRSRAGRISNTRTLRIELDDALADFPTLE